MTLISAIGLTAGTLTTIAQLPQAIRIYKLKETRDLSLSTYIITDIGVLLWLIYGITINDAPLYLANLITFLITFSITLLKLKYG